MPICAGEVDLAQARIAVGGVEYGPGRDGAPCSASMA